MTNDANSYSEVPIPLSTCTMTWKLSNPAPADASGVVVSLFVSIKDIAYANSAGSAGNNPSCKSDANQQSAVCLNGYAVPYPYVGEADPVIESFKIREEGTGYLGMVHTATYAGKPVGAFQRGYFDGTSMAMTGCSSGSWLEGIIDNGDGSWKMNVALGEQGSFTIFDAFKFENHSGSCSDIRGQKINYTATKM